MCCFLVKEHEDEGLLQKKEDPKVEKGSQKPDKGKKKRKKKENLIL